MYADDITLHGDLNPSTHNFVNIINDELGNCQSGFLRADSLLMLTKLRLCFYSIRKTFVYPKLYIDNTYIGRVDSFIFLELQINFSFIIS